MGSIEGIEEYDARVHIVQLIKEHFVVSFARGRQHQHQQYVYVAYIAVAVASSSGRQVRPRFLVYGLTL